jgi:hypothetical protein
VSCSRPASTAPSLSRTDITAQVTAKAHANAAAKAALAGAAGGPSAADPPGGTFAAKHDALVAALKHHAASQSALPERLPAATVAAWTFNPPPAQSLGGAHTKGFHPGPDGSIWMFKPDKTAGGARAQAEASASEVFARGGVPAVPVYARTLGGTPGSIQPLVPGTSTMSPNPANWSQADVDAMVRYHVPAWLIGDHDGKQDNVLRTSAGGLIPCDHGQAFKFFGRDQLSTSYHPNGSYGADRPVYHQAYLAAKAGELASGVHIRPEVALPVIKAFEAIPDAEYRALLHRTAHDGVHHGGVHWAEPMRARAAARHGTSQPTAAQVAEEFLTHALERKKGLRAAFAKFFTGEGFAGGDKLSQVT